MPEPKPMRVVTTVEVECVTKEDAERFARELAEDRVSKAIAMERASGVAFEFKFEVPSRSDKLP